MKTKLVLTALLAFCCSLLKAQTITDASTAQDAIKVLETAAQSIIGKQDSKETPVTEVRFTGNSFHTVSKSSLTFQYTWQNINWAEFDNFSSSPPKDGKILAMFFFKTKSLKLNRTTLNSDGSLYESKTEDDSAFDFYIPASEEGQLKNLEAAAKRLQQLVKENKAVFAKSETGSKIKTIEGKPSFSETAIYINTYLRDGQHNDLFCNSVTYKNRYAAVVEKNGTVYLTSKYFWQGRYTAGSPTFTADYQIDLSKVEEIKVVRGEGFEGGCCQFGLWFVLKGEGATAKMHLPLWYHNNSTSNDSFKEEKIYKAFNHLRKLCGAPEPLEF